MVFVVGMFAGNHHRFSASFIEDIGTNGPGSFHGRILNVSGCGNSPSGTAVATGSSTAIPVGLIHQ
jgi:hypothetical protein